MIEKDTLIKILDCCIEDDCFHCPNTYKDGSIVACEDFARGYVCVPLSVVRGTIQALKERDEPIEPTLNENHSYVSDAFKCGKCGHIIKFHAKYCEDCGQAVKWNA